MISTEKLLYDVDFRLNKVAANANQSIFLEDKIVAINHSLVKLVKQKLNPNNIYKLGVDSFNKRLDDFRTIIPPEYSIGVSKISDDRYLADISIVPDYMFFLKCYIVADKGECTNRVLDVNIIPHADIREWLSSQHLCPSFEYQETFGVMSSDGIEVYTDSIFIPTSLHIIYIRYPKPVDYPGYIHLDGVASALVDSDLPDYLRDEIVDLAVQELAMATDNVNAVEFTNQRIANNE